MPRKPFMVQHNPVSACLALKANSLQTSIPSCTTHRLLTCLFQEHSFPVCVSSPAPSLLTCPTPGLTNQVPTILFSLDSISYLLKLPGVHLQGPYPKHLVSSQSFYLPCPPAHSRYYNNMGGFHLVC